MPDFCLLFLNRILSTNQCLCHLIVIKLSRFQKKILRWLFKMPHEKICSSRLPPDQPSKRRQFHVAFDSTEIFFGHSFDAQSYIDQDEYLLLLVNMLSDSI